MCLQIIQQLLPSSCWQSQSAHQAFCLSTSLPPPFCSLGELSSFVVRFWSPYHHWRPIQLSISTHKHSVSHSQSQHLSPSHTFTNIPFLWGETAAVVLEQISAGPFAAPFLHLLCGSSRDTLPWPGPRNQGVRTRVRGNKRGKGRYHEWKRKNRAYFK